LTLIFDTDTFFGINHWSVILGQVVSSVKATMFPVLIEPVSQHAKTTLPQL